jgi:2-C-methyl-D-erythritol 2,4-cyclodiphosphate synthase
MICGCPALRSKEQDERMSIRIGQGWDSHAFKAGVPLKIGGVAIEHHEGLAGHSDGDVLLHAITDALLGAVAAGDIGTFFPPGDARWKDADSAIFLNLAIEEIQNAGYRIVNVDTTLVLAAPKISPIAVDIRERIADMLDVELNAVSVKAKTPEGMGLDHVAQAHAIVLIEKIEEPGRPQSMSAVIESQMHLEDVVKDLVSQVHGTQQDSGVTEVVPRRRTVKLPSFDTDDIT